MTRAEEILGHPFEKNSSDNRNESIKAMIGGVLEQFNNLGERIKSLEQLLEEKP